MKTAKSIADFKFNKKRVRVLSADTEFPDDGDGVLYWMSRDQRVQGVFIVNFYFIYRLFIKKNNKEPLNEYFTSQWPMFSLFDLKFKFTNLVLAEC